MLNKFETIKSGYPEGFLKRKEEELNKLGTTISEIQEKIISEFGSLEKFKAEHEKKTGFGGNEAGAVIDNLSEQEESFEEEKRKSLFRGISVASIATIIEAFDLYTSGGNSVSEQVANIKAAFETQVMSEMTAYSMLMVLFVTAGAYFVSEMHDAYKASRASGEVAKEKKIKNITFGLNGVPVDRGNI